MRLISCLAYRVYNVSRLEERASAPFPSFSSSSFSHFSSPLVGFLHSRFSFIFLRHVLEMFSFTRMISSVSAALVVASVSSVLAAPIQSNVTTSLVSRATIPSPAFVIYSDKFVSGVLPPATQLAVSPILLVLSGIHFTDMTL